MVKEKVLFEAGAVLSKKVKGGIEWLVVKQDAESEWEFPKGMTRKGESSVRAAIRILSEKVGVQAKVLEEAGRTGGATKYKDQIATKRTFYYLMQFKNGFEMLAVADAVWLEYSKASKSLGSKREKAILAEANKIIKKMMKDGFKLKYVQPENEFEE